ncbi:hypothetical protein HOI71_11620, partial [Candidatus Poribacteria bacterium]|nr:hypothetical protein [Candidatus Poribacteria bacterium]
MVPPNDLLKRMEALNRRPLKDRAPERKDADPPPEDRERPRRSARPPQAPVMPTATLGDMPTGVEVQSDAGPALLVTTDVDTYDADCAGLSAKFREQVDDRESPFHRNVARRGELNIRGVEDV